MSKIFITMRKNFLFLLRNKFSAFAILVGPVLIMLLIGFALTTPSTYELTVGVNKINNTELTGRFIENMESQGFVVLEFDSIEECISTIKRGNTQTCILFPDDFEISNDKTNEIKFYVDESRTNFVYEIIDTVSSNLGVETAELSQDLTQRILSALLKTQEGLDESIADIIKMKSNTEKALSTADESTGTVSEIDLSTNEVDVDHFVGTFEDLLEVERTIRTESEALVAIGKELVSDLESAGYAGDLTDIKTSLNTVNDLAEETETNEESIIAKFSNALVSLRTSVEDYESKLSSADESRTKTIKQIESFKSRINSVQTELDKLKTLLEGLNADINNIEITSSETISKPIITTIEPVSAQSQANKLFFLFPYLLMLVILFIGLMLPSTLIVVEKRSRSSFRTFCTPTNDGVFMLAQFLTSFIIIICQTAVILLMSYYFMGSALFANSAVSASLLVLGIIMFILIGMAIGYIFNSQESVTMASISLSSIFIFISNLVLPIETLGAELQRVAMFNPYVMTSDSIRRAVLFGSNFEVLTPELVSLAAYCAIFFVIIIIAKDIQKSQYKIKLAFMRGHRKVQKPTDIYLRLGDVFVKDLYELLDWLKKVDDGTFEDQLHWNEMRVWLRNEKALRVRLAGKSRARMIEVLVKKLKK